MRLQIAFTIFPDLWCRKSKPSRQKTVRIHVSSMLDKMGARDRTQATIFALQRGFVHLD
jgi:hypothetical protein